MGVSEINLEALKRLGLLTRGAKSENLQCVSLGGTVKSLNLYHQFRLCPEARYRRDKVYTPGASVSVFPLISTCP